MDNLTSVMTRHLDTNGNAYYFIVDHDTLTITPLSQIHPIDRYKPDNQIKFRTKKEVKEYHEQFIANGYQVKTGFTN